MAEEGDVVVLLQTMGLKRVLQAFLALLIAECVVCFSPGATLHQGGRLRRPHRCCDSAPPSQTLLCGRSRPQSSGLILAMANGGGNQNSNRSDNRKARQRKRLSAQITHTYTQIHTKTHIHTHTHSHAHTNTHAHTHTHTHTHTYIHTHQKEIPPTFLGSSPKSPHPQILSTGLLSAAV